MVRESKYRKTGTTINNPKGITNKKKPIKINKWKEYYNNLLTEYLDKQMNVTGSEVGEVKVIKFQEKITALLKLKNNKAP